jgi:putative IMPACT (imprinted ancient) family translation regulator
MFVGYDDINDSSKYTIYMKWATLEETEKVYEVLDKYGKTKRNRTDSNSSIATSDESVLDSDSDDDESENN